MKNKVILNGIELKPGMVLITENNECYIVFPGYDKKLALVKYGGPSWNPLPWKIVTDQVIKIKKSVGSHSVDGGKTIWERKSITITMDEIAEKFNTPVEYINITK